MYSVLPGVSNELIEEQPCFKIGAEVVHNTAV